MTYRIDDEIAERLAIQRRYERFRRRWRWLPRRLRARLFPLLERRRRPLPS